MEDSQIDAIHQDFKNEQDGKEAVINKIPSNIKLIAVAILGFVIWYFGFKNDEWVKTLFICAVLIVSIYLWATTDDTGEKRELNDLELRTLLWKQLRYYQLNPFGTHYVIPDGDIQIMPTVARWSVADVVKYRTYGVCIRQRNKVPKNYAIDVNIYSGDIVKVEESYFTGREKPHVKYIESEDVAKKKRLDDVLGTNTKGKKTGSG